MANIIMVIDRIADIYDDAGELIGKEVFAKDGKGIKVKNPRGCGLKERWSVLDEGVGKAFEFIRDQEFQGHPFVTDFKEVKDVFVAKAAEKVASQSADSKNRSYALSYAKDWCIAQVQGGKDLKAVDILTIAKLFESYLDSGVTVKNKEEPK